jgi:ubiquinone biosynthesis protein COQ4
MSPLPELTPEQALAHERAKRLQPLAALRAMRRSVRDPDDTEQAVRMLTALAGRSTERMMERFTSTRHGPEILERQHSLLDRLMDRESLQALPPGSFGRTYVEWLEREQISAEGLVAASEAAGAGEGERDGPYFVLASRMRESHDLLHVITGYGRDLVGEVGVLAFTYAQTRHSGIAFLLAVAYVRSFFGGRGMPGTASRKARAEVRRHLREGYRRGCEADWIAGSDWEALLGLPIEEVRQRFRIPEPPVYRELRSRGAPVLAN